MTKDEFCTAVISLKPKTRVRVTVRGARGERSSIVGRYMPVRYMPFIIELRCSDRTLRRIPYGRVISIQSAEARPSARAKSLEKKEESA